MKKVLKYFEKVDPVIFEAARMYGLDEIVVVTTDKYFERLCRAIVGQQLSTKAAATIWRRFVELLNDSEVSPGAILGLEHERLREAGLSNAKANYVRGIAQAYEEGEIDFPGLAVKDNESVVAELVKLKGVGVWTAEMFLMFTLGRADVFSVGDLGLRRAIEKLYKIEEVDENRMREIADKWSPYRTYGCMVLWNSLDNNPDM